MMRDFFEKYAGCTKLPPAVLRAMWDDLSGISRERDARQEQIDNRVLQWMADEGVCDEHVFWDLRELNGATGEKYNPLWDEMGA